MDESTGGINRRRVLQGAAWAAPVIVLATSAPAAAASPAVPGYVVLTGVTANLTTDKLTVNAKVGYGGDGGAAPDLPVSDLIVTIVVPSSAIVAGTPTSGSVFWTYLDSAVEGSNRAFRFAWAGGNLTATNSPTVNMPVQWVRSASDPNPVTVVVRANGTSNSLPVPEVTQTVTTVWGASLVFNVTPPMQAQTNYQGLGPAYVFYGQPRWNGPWYPAGQPVSGLTVVATVPEANSTGQLVAGNIGVGWTLADGPTVVDGHWRVVYTNPVVLSSAASSPSELQFALISATPPPQLNVAQLRAQGVTPDNTVVFVEFSGPTVLNGPIATTPYPPDYPF